MSFSVRSLGLISLEAPTLLLQVEHLTVLIVVIDSKSSRGAKKQAYRAAVPLVIVWPKDFDGIAGFGCSSLNAGHFAHEVGLLVRVEKQVRDKARVQNDD